MHVYMRTCRHAYTHAYTHKHMHIYIERERVYIVSNFLKLAAARDTATNYFDRGRVSKPIPQPLIFSRLMFVEILEPIEIPQTNIFLFSPGSLLFRIEF